MAPRSLNSVGLGWGLVPFGYGYGYYPPPVVVGGGGGGVGDLFIFGLFAFVAVTILSSFLNSSSDDGGSAGSERVTIARLQVGLLGSARALQRDLDRIAARADTSTPSGLHYVLQGEMEVGGGR